MLWENSGAVWQRVCRDSSCGWRRWRFAKRSYTVPGRVSIKTIDCDRRHLPIVCPCPLGLLRGQEEQLLFSLFSNSGACLKQEEEEEEERGLGLCFGEVFPFCGVCVGGIEAHDRGNAAFSSVMPPLHSEAPETTAPFDAVTYRNRL